MHLSLSANAEAVGTLGTFPYQLLCLTALGTGSSAKPGGRQRSPCLSSPQWCVHGTMESQPYVGFLYRWWDLNLGLHTCAPCILIHWDVIPAPRMKGLLRYDQTLGYGLFLEKHFKTHMIIQIQLNIFLIDNSNFYTCKCTSWFWFRLIFVAHYLIQNS